MTEHYTRNTLEVTSWCPQCQRPTQHRVDAGRKGPCIDPQHPPAGSAGGLTQTQARRREKERRAQQKPALFPEDAA
jgi:hypothetical protein